MRLLALFTAFALALTSCGFSETLAVCDNPDAEPPPPEELVSDVVALNFENEVYQPGDRINFSWTIAAGENLSSLSTLDSLTVQCWDGTSWNSTWQATEIYGPEPSFRSVDKDRSITLAAAPLDNGIIAIPDSTPPGWYRVRTSPRPDIQMESRFVIEAES